MIRFIPCSTLITFVIAYFIGCSKDPNAVGIGIIPNTDTLRTYIVETHATWDTTYSHRLVGGFFQLHIGQYQNLEAKTLLEFTDIPKLPPLSMIESTYIALEISYRFKDSSGQLDFSAHKMLHTWDERTFTRDSLVSGSYETNTLASFQQVIKSEDRIIRLFFDTLLSRSWCDSGRSSIILIPKHSDIIVGCVRPTFYVVYKDSLDSTQTIKKFPKQQTFITTGDPPSISDILFLQAGKAWRSFLRFDSDTLKKLASQKVSITRAILEITMNDYASLSNFVNDTLVVFLERRGKYPYDSLALPSLCTKKDDTNSRVYSAEVNSIVQQWITNSSGFGIVLTTFRETTTFDRFAIYSSTAVNTANRPKIIITYTVLP